MVWIKIMTWLRLGLETFVIVVTVMVSVVRIIRNQR